MFLKILSHIYGCFVDSRNKKFDNQKSNTIKCRAQVISIGNISAGGSGKTPLTIALTEELLKLGKKTVVIGRGYKKKTKGAVVVSDGQTIRTNPLECGDEMLQIALAVPVPVIAHEDKSEAAMLAENMFSPDVIIVDDGFQHRRLYRNLDIVILDKDTINNPFLLPYGRLRERLENINRADVVAVYDDLPDDLLKFVSEKQLLIKLKLIAELPYLADDKDVRLNNKLIEGKTFFAISSIAKPQKFEQSLIELNINYSEHLKFRDHHFYKEDDIKKILANCNKQKIKSLITTEKDSVKLKQFLKIFKDNNIECFVLPVRLEIIEGKQDLLEKLNQ